MKAYLPSGCHQAGILKRRSVAGFELTEIAYCPDLRLQAHRHERAGFCLVLSGAYTEDYGRTALACRPQTVTFSPAQEKHSNHFGRTGSRCLIIDVDGQELERLREHSVRIDGPAYFYGGALSWLAARLYSEFKTVDEASDLIIEGLALEMIGEAGRSAARMHAGRIPPWLSQAKELLHERFLESISLVRVAESVGVHPVYLASEFRRHFGLTVGEYVRRLRIEYACREISTRKDAVLAQVALAAGFSSQSHFSRTFKRLTGMTPLEYRDLCNKP
jgi:AraC family transcriptional regulator